MVRHPLSSSQRVIVTAEGEFVKVAEMFPNHLPRVRTGQARGVCFSGEKDGERFAPCVQSQVPPTRRSTLQSVNWSTKHRCVWFVLLKAFTSIFSFEKLFSVHV